MVWRKKNQKFNIYWKLCFVGYTMSTLPERKLDLWYKVLTHLKTVSIISNKIDFIFDTLGFDLNIPIYIYSIDPLCRIQYNIQYNTVKFIVWKNVPGIEKPSHQCIFQVNIKPTARLDTIVWPIFLAPWKIGILSVSVYRMHMRIFRILFFETLIYFYG